MNETPRNLYVEFNNNAPDTIEWRAVSDMDVKKLVIPEEAINFRFYTVDGNRAPQPKSPIYHLGTEFDTAAEMAKKYPDQKDLIKVWVEGWAIQTIAKIEWDLTSDGTRYKGGMLMPLNEDSVLFNKTTRDIVWPAPKTLTPLTSDELIPLLQDAYAKAAFGQHPSDNREIHRKWKLVADHLLSGKQSEKSDRNALAIELHAVFLEVGHRTEIMGRADYDPPLIGWRGVAEWVIKTPLL